MRPRQVRWLSVLALLVGLPAAAVAQATGTVRGRVIDASTGQPVADAQIQVMTTTLGTLTNAQGEYILLNVPAGQRGISARRIGYGVDRQTVDVVEGQTATLDFRLVPAAVTLDEVVSTGVAAPAARRVVGNAVETVEAAEINQAPGATAIDQALQGKVTGALITENSGQPGGGVSVRLRGTGSILGGGEPLYVVDGVIVDNSSEALISLGANAGRGGAALSNRLADLDPEDVERIEVLKGAAAAALYGSRANNGVIQIFTKRGQTGAPVVRFSTEYSTGVTPEKYDLNMAPFAGVADVAFGGISGLEIGDPVTRYDYQDEIFRRSQGTDNNISVSGGSERTTYYLSGGYTQQDGILESSDYNRVSLRANVGQEVSDKLDLALRGSYVRSKASFVPEGEQTYGVLTSVIFTPTVFNPAFNPDLGRYPYNPVLGGNPLEVLADWKADELVTRFTGSFEATVRPIDKLTVRYVAGLDDYRNENTFFQPPQSISAGFTGLIQNPVQIVRQFNNDLQASYATTISSVGSNSTVGFRYTDNRDNTLRLAAQDLPPGQQLVGGAVQFASESETELRTIGFFVEERLSFNDRLYLTGGLNWDASSAFGQDERLQMFPRLSLSYVVSEEPFFEVPFVSSLRLRAAYGETGGQPPGLYSRFANYINTSFAGRPALVPSSLAGNPGIKPERQREYEFGFDAGFLEDRIQTEFSYYDKRTEDLVLSIPLPPSRGFGSQFQNIGALTNRGIELALNTVNVTQPGFTWRSRLQYAHNRNEVTKLATAADTLLFGYLNAVIEGQPVGVFYGGVYARTADGAIAYDARGLPLRGRDTLATGASVNAARVIGDPNPDFTLSFSNTFEIGTNMQVGVLFDGRFGNDVANFTRRITEFFGSDAKVAREITGDTIPQTYTLNPNGRIQIYEEYIEDGSFVKLREVSWSYRFDQPWVASTGAESVTLRLAGRNLYTWTDYSGLDPEVNLFSANTVARGVDFATTPLPRELVASLSFTF